MDIVVIGGGIAGLKAAKALSATLITDSPVFVFKPTLTDTLRGGLSVAQKPIDHKPLIIDRVESVDTANRTVKTAKGTHSYDSVHHMNEYSSRRERITNFDSRLRVRISVPAVSESRESRNRGIEDRTGRGSGIGE